MYLKFNTKHIWTLQCFSSNKDYTERLTDQLQLQINTAKYTTSELRFVFVMIFCCCFLSLPPPPFFPFTSLRLHIIHVCTSNWFSGAYRSIYAHVYAHPHKHWKSWQKIYFLFIFWKWLINFLHYIGLC